jgi:hypothetical protein
MTNVQTTAATSTATAVTLDVQQLADRLREQATRTGRWRPPGR